MIVYLYMYICAIHIENMDEYMYIFCMNCQTLCQSSPKQNGFWVGNPARNPTRRPADLTRLNKNNH